MDNNLCTCIPLSLSEKTLDKDPNRPRQPEHQREREPTLVVVWRVEEKRRTYRGGEIGVRGRVIAVLAQLCLQLPKPRRRKLSLSLSLFFYLFSPHLFPFFTFKIEQLSFFFFSFKKVSFLFPSFSILPSKLELDFFLFSSHG